MFRHWLFLIFAFSRLAVAYLHSFWRLFRGINKGLKLDDTTSLSPKEMRRVRHYFLGSTYLMAIFNSLQGGNRGDNLNLSALASFFDDLVDEYRKKVVNVPFPLADPLAFALIADDRKIARHFLSNVQKTLSKDNLVDFQQYMQRVYTVELEGQHASDKPLNITQIKNIMSEKGGCSVMLFRTLIHPLPSQEEEIALLEFGCLIQLSDDIFDLWFDRRQGVTTVATLLVGNGRVGEIEAIFEQQLSRTNHAFSAIPVSKWRILTALEMIHVLTSITRVCLLRYQKLEKKYGTLPLSDRQLMVVDMEKWSNRLMAARVLFFSC